MWIGNMSFWSQCIFSQIMSAIEFNTFLHPFFCGCVIFLCLTSIEACIDTFFKICSNGVRIREVLSVLRFAYFDLDSYSDPPMLQFACLEYFEKHPFWALLTQSLKAGYGYNRTSSMTEISAALQLLITPLSFSILSSPSVSFHEKSGLKGHS